MIFKIEYVSANAIENNPFMIDRPEGSYRFIFFHFISEVTIEINGETIDANPGSIILYSPKEKQKFYVNKNRLNHEYIDFQIMDETFFKSIKFPLNTLLQPKMSNYISQKIKEIVNEKVSDQVGNTYIIESKMIELFVSIARKVNHRNRINSEIYTTEIKNKFENIRLKMYQSPDNSTVNNLAKSLGFSLSRFNTLYKAFFGITPIKDLTKARVTRVEELINNGYSTKEIIKRIGFSSEEYYYRWFKKQFKKTTEDYIKGRKEND